MAVDLSHDPAVLYRASSERKEAAWNALAKGDHVLAFYLAGLSVECILQAIALLDDPTQDAKHDLAKWLARCRSSLQEAVKTPPVREDWNLVVRVWRNELRYLSWEGMLGYVRRFHDLVRGIRGGPDAIMQSVAQRVLEAAATVHSKGVSAWNRYTKK